MTGPRKWSLDNDPKAPEPAAPDKPGKPREVGLATHTGTDPYGRAIGPAEDHTKPKLDSEGRTAADAATDVKESKKSTSSDSTSPEPEPKKAPAKKAAAKSEEK